jgi:hypothetical protein
MQNNDPDPEQFCFHKNNVHTANTPALHRVLVFAPLNGTDEIKMKMTRTRMQNSRTSREKKMNQQ